MASSEEKPASAANESADASDGKDGSGGEEKATRKPKKTLIGLGKLRKSLEKASSGKKGKSLRIPKPSKSKKKTSLGLSNLPKPGAKKAGDDADADAKPPKRSTMILEPEDEGESVEAQPAGESDESPGESDVEPDDAPDVSDVGLDESPGESDVEVDASSGESDVEPEVDEPPTDRIEEELVDEELVEEDSGPPTDRIDEDVIDEDVGVAEDNGPPTDRVDGDLVDEDVVEADNGPPTDRIEGDALPSALLDDVELDADDSLDEPMEAEATMLTDSPFDATKEPSFGAEPVGSTAEDDFGGDATMVTDSLLGEQTAELAAAEDDFGGDATMVTDSLLGAEEALEGEFDGGDKTTVSLAGSPAMPEARPDPAEPSTERTHSTHPTPPTPEQKSPTTHPPRSAPDTSGDLQAEGTLTDDADPGEFHAEATEVFDSPYENEALVPRLSALSGPATGQEFLLNKQRNTIGRGKNNTILVADLAMSRQHIEIAKNNDQSYTVIDLQSANGTKLNGTRIEEAELLHGDRLEAGKTEFQFVIPGNRPQQRSRNRRIVPKREVSTPGTNTMIRQMSASKGGDETTDRILTYVIVGAGVLSLVLIGTALFLYFNDTSADPSASQVASAQAPQAQVRFLAGVDKVKERDWQAAGVIFEQLAEDHPELPGVQAQLERIEREKTAQTQLERARELLENGKPDMAARIAMSVSNESTYFDDAQDVVRRTRHDRIAALYQKAQEAVTEEDFDSAKEHLDSLLEQVPNHKGAHELRETLEASARQEEEEENKAQARRAAADNSSKSKRSSNDDWLRGSSGSSSKRSNSGRRGRVNFTEGFTLYKSGKFKAAAAHFRDIASGTSGSLKSRAQKAADNIDRFSGTYRRASRAFDAGAWKTAVDALGKAKSADRAVARSGYFRQEIGAKLARAHASLGLKEFANGNFTSASQHYAKGKRNGSSSDLTSLRRKLSNKARSLYIQAANKRKTDPKKAADLCREIMAIVPASNSMHKKAKSMLAEVE